MSIWKVTINHGNPTCVNRVQVRLGTDIRRSVMEAENTIDGLLDSCYKSLIKRVIRLFVYLLKA